MRIKIHVLVLFCLIIASACKRKPDYHPIKNIGNDVPSLRVKKWLKGIPVEEFEKGKVYVVEFWATWCVPCKASMPHLSALAKQYKDQATFIAIDVYEQKTGTTISEVQNVVNAMGDKMHFPVAAEDSNFMAHDWIESSGEFSIPSTFVIDQNGKVAWIGHPKDLGTILPKIINHTWNIKTALSERNLKVEIANLDEQIGEKVSKFAGFWNNNTQSNDFGNPDSALLVIDSMVKVVPELKFEPNTAYFTLYSQLKADRLNDAYQYSKQAMAAVVTDKETLYSNLIKAIRYTRENYHQIKITPDIYQIAAECQQKLFDIQSAYPEHVDIPSKYKKIAMWYRLAGDKPKALEAEKNALQFYRRP